MCDFKAKTQRSLKKHFERRHNTSKIKTIQCDQCEYKTESMGNLKKHVERIHKNKKKENYYYCKACDKTFSTKKYHVEKVHLGIRHTCAQCGLELISKEHLKSHIRSKHGEKIYKCRACDFRTAYKGGLKKHNITVHKEWNKALYKCETCDYETKERGNLEAHVKYKHMKLSATCDICQLVVRDDYLERHKSRIHDPTYENNVTCQICGKVLHKDSLSNHMITHNTINFECSFCDFKCTSNSEKYRHLYTEHPTEKLDNIATDKSFCHNCEYCDHKSSTKSSLKRHIDVVHLGVRYSCNLCQSEFLDKGT